MLKPCIECGRLSEGTRCLAHRRIERARLEARRGPRPWYQGDWPTLRAQVHGQPCVYCGAPSDTADHVIPRFIEGGVVPACRSCNSRKKNR
jgi:5-methylcytosine-specific restriction endonuclease McrA